MSRPLGSSASPHLFGVCSSSPPSSCGRCSAREGTPSTVLDHMAERAVRELWQSRVKTFVPILALRQARALLQDQGRGIPREWSLANGDERPATTGSHHVEWSPRDLLHLDADVLRLDDRDVQHG